MSTATALHPAEQEHRHAIDRVQRPLTDVEFAAMVGQLERREGGER